MLHILKRHPIPIAARFEHALSLSYAFSPEILKPLLHPGLELDTYGNQGFVAVVTVRTVDLRPAFLPKALGKSFFLTSYRLFTRYKAKDGQMLRGLQILRSDTDGAWMRIWGNRFTRYGYRKADIAFRNQDGLVHLDVKTPRAEADLEVTADISNVPGPLPKGSPFPDIDSARQFVGPLPFTFNYEPETHSMILMRGSRTNWQPQSLKVEVHRNTFVQSPPFGGSNPVLANAFYAADIPYRWDRGWRERLPAGQESMNPVRT